MSKLTTVERFLKYAGAVVNIPFAPLWLFSVKANTECVITRFGKIDRIVQPGLRWTVPFAQYYDVFVGAQTHTFKDMRIIDSTGTPVIVTGIVQYHISDSGSFIMNANRKTDVLERAANDAIRKHCAANMKELRFESLFDTFSVNESVSKFGFTVTGLTISEVCYAPEVVQQMLMKQQALAYIDARKSIVDGAIGVAKDAIEKLPELSKESQEQIVTNILTILTSGNAPQPVLHLK
jgi:regulator of protease activity HflC (stomatin/prohibitin superfamily)